MEKLRRLIVVCGVIGTLAAVALTVTIDRTFAQGGAPAGTEQKPTVVVNQSNALYYLGVVAGAALAAGFGFIGGGYAVAHVGAAALGAASERPELLVRSLVFVALGEGIAIFGLVVALLLILKLPS